MAKCCHDLDLIQYFIGANKHVSHSVPDAPCRFKDKIGKTSFDFNTKETERTLWYKGSYKGKPVEVNATMEIPEGLESITTVFPFDEDKTKYFMIKIKDKKYFVEAVIIPEDFWYYEHYEITIRKIN